MATEIIGAKLLAPLFGASLYVWSTVMAMTLGGLAVGYFLGGRLSQSDHKDKKLFFILLMAGLFIIAMPLFVHLLAGLAFKLPLLAGVVICAFFILVPPVFCMGMVSPLIVQLLSKKDDDGGRRAGEVYAISTVGGILATFLTGFYLIPTLGLHIPLFMFGGLLLCFSVIYFMTKKQFTMLFVVLFVGTAALLNLLKTDSAEKIIYKSEGLLGKLEVIETDWDTDSASTIEHHRLLLINNIIQTWIETGDNTSQLEYVEQIENLTATSEVKNVLLLGLGGGAVAASLSKAGMEVTAVELDERMIEVAQKYFGLPSDVRVITDDARHAMEQLNEQYDIIVVDLFNGEVTPSHVLSIESIDRMKTLLTENGKIIFNTYGYIDLPYGQGNISLLKTLSESGLKYRIGMNGKTEQEDYRNFLIVASQSDLPEVENEYTEPIDIAKGDLITDANPVLEYQNAGAAKRWRYYYLHNFISRRKDNF